MWGGKGLLFYTDLISLELTGILRKAGKRLYAMIPKLSEQKPVGLYFRLSCLNASSTSRIKNEPWTWSSFYSTQRRLHLL